MAHDKLKSLKCFPQVHDKICAGVACETVAEWIQGDCGEYTDAKIGSVIRALYRYKEDLPATALAIPEPLHVHKKIEKLRRGVNELSELEKLYLLQIARISKAVEVEDKINFLNKDVRKEMELAKELLVEMANLKVETGLYERQGHKFTLGVEGEVNHNHRQVLEEMDPDKRRKLGVVAQELLKRLTAPTEAPEAVLTDGKSDRDPETLEADFEVVEADYGAQEAN